MDFYLPSHVQVEVHLSAKLATDQIYQIYILSSLIINMLFWVVFALEVVMSCSSHQMGGLTKNEILSSFIHPLIVPIKQEARAPNANIFLNILLCVQQNKGMHTGLEVQGK